MNEGVDVKSWGSGGLYGTTAMRAVLSLVLIILTPIFVLTFWYVCVHEEGSFRNFYQSILKGDTIHLLSVIFPSPFYLDSWKLIGSFMLLELILMKVIPGKVFKGTATPTGHIPIYNANGIQCYTITLGVLFVLTYFEWFDPSIVYDNMGKLLSSMCFFALIFCTFLTWKGLYFPSTKDCGSNGNIIVDFFWGTELYPRLFGWDVKQFTNCRFGMMFWQVGIICYAIKQFKNLDGTLSSSILVSVLLQSVYIAKFFWWETGYFCSMDIQHDRAGYYLCWGCMVWVPSIYTFHTFYMVEHPLFLSVPTALFFIFAGLFSIWCNYDCDRQRQEFRNSNGKQKIWGKEPEYIVAKYTTEDGEERSSLLLTSGWWGLSRHFHYIPEILAAFFWCVPALFSHPFPYFYPFYLTILLCDRAWRDDARCQSKYKESWDLYCKKVPYKIIPGII